MTCPLFGVKPLFKPMMTSHQKQNFNEKHAEVNKSIMKKLRVRLSFVFLHYYVHGKKISKYSLPLYRVDRAKSRSKWNISMRLFYIEIFLLTWWCNIFTEVLLQGITIAQFPLDHLVRDLGIDTILSTTWYLWPGISSPVHPISMVVFYLSQTNPKLPTTRQYSKQKCDRN